MGNPLSNKEWDFWGRTDPLFGVASLPGKEVHGRSPWTDEEFLEMGRLYFADVWKQWCQFGTGSLHCVEIGCGSARITNQLAQVFDHVTALDISAEQLARARELLGENRTRVTLQHVNSPAIPLPDACVDAVFSCEVFQHFDSEAPFIAYMQEAFRVLGSGGSICFQVPVQGIHRASFLASPARTRILQLLRWFGRRRMMIYRQFRADQVFDILSTTGFQNLEMRVFHAAEQFHMYFFGEKL